MLSLLVGIGGAHPQRSCPQGRGWAWDSPSLLPRPPGLLLGCGDAELDPGVLLLLLVAWGVARRAFGGLQPSRGPVPSPRSRCPQLQRGWGRWALPLGCPRCSRRASPATPGRSCLLTPSSTLGCPQDSASSQASPTEVWGVTSGPGQHGGTGAWQRQRRGDVRTHPN